MNRSHRTRRQRCVRALAPIVMVGAGLLLATACSPAPTPNKFPHAAAPTAIGPIGDADALQAYLEESGVVLPVPEDLDYDWFDVPGRSYPLNEDATNAIVVHTYSDTAAALAAADTLSNGGQLATLPDGSTMRIAWPAPPHVYVHGPLLVIYVGGEGQIMHLLTLALGQQVEGPVPPPGVGVR